MSSDTVTLTVAGFDDLSTEIIIDILSRLDHLQLVCCRRLCQRVRTIIDSTPLLQYTIEFSAAGYFPARKRGSTIADALEQFRRVQKALRDPRPCLQRRIPLQVAQRYGARQFRGFIRHYVATCDDLLVAILDEEDRHEDDDDNFAPSPRALAILSLRSKDMPMARRFRVVEYNVGFQRIYVDVQQDLVILGDVDLLHFRSLTTGKIHPKVTQRADGTFTTSVSGIQTVDGEDVCVQVDRDWMLADSEPPHDELYLYMWHWPTGHRVLAWPSTVMAHATSVLQGCLCRGHLIVLVGSGGQCNAQLDVIALPESGKLEGVLTHTASYELPGFDLWGISTPNNTYHSADLQSGYSMLYVDFGTARLWIALDALTMCTAKPLAGDCVPWKVWGPKNTRKITDKGRVKVFGNTLLTKDNVISFNALDVARDLYAANPSRESQVDFNQFPCRRARIQVPGGDVFAPGSGSRSDFFACINDGGIKFIRVGVSDLPLEAGEFSHRTRPIYLEIYTLCGRS